MSQLNYYYSKMKRAVRDGTVRERCGRFLLTSLTLPVEVLIGAAHLSKADRNLNTGAGYADHRQTSYHRPSNPDHLCRIIAAYKAAKIKQREAATPFVIKGLWDEWITINFKDLISALESEDIASLGHLFENLFREPFTVGIGGYNFFTRYRKLLGKSYVKCVWSKYRDALRDLDFDLGKIDFPPVGNPTGVLLNGSVISFEALRHAYHAVEIRHLLRDVSDPTILEIGGGLGGQAYQTINALVGQQSKYLIFDIPEVAALSSYFLLSAFPDKRVRLFGEGSFSLDGNEEYDIAVFPHFSIDRLPASSIDLFYNSCSFSEMDAEASTEYLAVIERSCRKYFLHDNHDSILKFQKPDGSISVNIIGSKLIPNPTLFKRLYKKPRVHGVPEDRSFVHFEYLYEKI